MNGKTIFGREPAFWISVIEAGLAVIVLMFLHWTTDQVTVVMAVIMALFALYTAWATSETMLGVVVGLAKALFALAIGFGLKPDPDTAAAVIAFIAIVAGAFNRQTTDAPVPKARTVLASGGVVHAAH